MSVFEPCSVKWGLNPIEKSFDHVSLRSPRRLTWVETFCYFFFFFACRRTILCHDLVGFWNLWINNMDRHRSWICLKPRFAIAQLILIWYIVVSMVSFLAQYKLRTLLSKTFKIDLACGWRLQIIQVMKPF